LLSQVVAVEVMALLVAITTVVVEAQVVSYWPLVFLYQVARPFL
jgi:hypothetical protein